MAAVVAVAAVSGASAVVVVGSMVDAGMVVADARVDVDGSSVVAAVPSSPDVQLANTAPTATAPATAAPADMNARRVSGVADGPADAPAAGVP